MTHSRFDKGKDEYKYSTIRDGRVKVTSRKQHMLLEARKLPHTHVYESGRRKRVNA